MLLKLTGMIHLRFDWRRKVLRASVCLAIFMSSSTAFNGKTKAGGENTTGNKIKSDIQNKNAAKEEIHHANKFWAYLYMVK